MWYNKLLAGIYGDKLGLQIFIRLLKILKAADMINASFTPFVVTADGALGLEAKTFMRHLAEK